MTAVVLMANPCTKLLGGGSGGHKHAGDDGRTLCWTFQANVHSGYFLLVFDTEWVMSTSASSLVKPAVVTALCRACCCYSSG